MQWDNAGAGVQIFDAATNVSLGQAIVTFANNDVLRFQASGTAISVLQNGSSVLSITDSTYSAAGFVGMGCKDTTARLDNFSFGNPLYLTWPYTNPDEIPAKYGPNCEVYYTVPTIPAISSNQIRLSVRKTLFGFGDTGYWFAWTNDTNGISLLAASTVIATNTAARFANGDQILLRAIGSNIAVYKNGVFVVGASNTTIPNAGYLSMAFIGTTARFTNFGGGTIPPRAPGINYQDPAVVI
jgi:hypothetical protein